MSFTRRIALTCLTALALGACGSELPDQPSASVSVSSSPTPDPVALAMRSRSKAGLRSDPAFVRALLDDPSAVRRGARWGMPITEVELRFLDGRQQNAAEVADVITTYGETHPDEWAGMYIDVRTGAVAVLFTDHLVDHENALAKLLDPGARWEVREARWSLAQLRALADRIKAEAEFLRSIGAAYYGGGVDYQANVANVFVQSDDPNVIQLITDHFDAIGMLRVDLIGNREWSGPRGRLVVVVRYPDLTPADELECELIPDVSAAWDETTRLTGPTGTCIFDAVGATGVKVRVGRSLADGAWETVGEGDATVLPNDVVVLQIVVPRQS